MSTGAMILGLGLFFLGMQLVGEFLRRLSGTGFRTTISRTAHSPLLASLAGLLFGALMQSATAVTFILASMVRSDLIKPRAALPILLWCNTGLTALAFLLSFSIHPLMGWIVGLSGIAFGLFRSSGPRAAAGILLGVGLILLGLQDMSAAAEPMKNLPWFQSALTVVEHAPFLAFLGGIAAAAILQSNTGATMLAITLAASGAFDVEIAAPLIYGTNLGAIFLRVFLAMGSPAGTRRLVRYEDVFVLFSGVTMMALFFIESAGVPLVLALSEHLGPSLPSSLAWIFLLSNALPAALFLPISERVYRLLEKWIPEEAEDTAGRPKYLADSALESPPSAIDLLEKETARLLSHVRIEPLTPPKGDADADSPPPDFTSLGAAIERYVENLSTGRSLSAGQARRLHLLRSQLSLVRHIEEAAREAGYDLPSTPTSPPLLDALSLARDLMAKGAEVAAKPDPQATASYHEASNRAKERLRALRPQIVSGTTPDPASANLLDDLDLVAWLLHRHAKLLQRL